MRVSVPVTEREGEGGGRGTHIPQLGRAGSGLGVCGCGCWETMRERLLGCARRPRPASGARERVLQYRTDVSAMLRISLHTASWRREARRRSPTPPRSERRRGWRFVVREGGGGLAGGPVSIEVERGSVKTRKGGR